MNNEASKLKDQDLVRWLENKLGDPKELWGSEPASSFLNKQVLIELETCFQALDAHVKIKILQASLHLSSKLVQAWRNPLNNLLSLARRDADDWVELVADLMRDYPDQGCIKCFPTNDGSIFYRTLQVLGQKISAFVEQNPDVVTLPPQCQYMMKTAVEETYKVSPPAPKKHFTVTKKLKSEIMMEDLLKQSAQMNDASGSRKGGSIVSSIPMMKMRSTAKDLNNTLPMRGIPSANVSKFSGGFTNEPKKYQRQLTAREGGAKLIDISELPQHQPGKRRFVQTKSKDVSVQKKVSKVSGSAKEQKPANQKKGPIKQEPTDGSIMTEPEVTLPSASTEEDAAATNPFRHDSSSIGASTLANPQSTLLASACDSLQSAYPLGQQQQNISAGASMLITPEATSHSTSMSQNPQSTQQQQNPPADFPTMSMANMPRREETNLSALAQVPNVSSVNAPINLTSYPAAVADNLNFTSGLPGGMNTIQSTVQSFAHQSAMPTIQPQSYALLTPQPSSAMQQFNMTNFGASSASSLPTTSQMDDETFTPEETELLQLLASEYNDLSPGLHELVVAFIRGSRENPLGPSAPPIVTFPLHNRIEYIENSQTITVALVEFIFQMDYRTGSWKKLQRRRELSMADMHSERIRSIADRIIINRETNHQIQVSPRSIAVLDHQFKQ